MAQESSLGADFPMSAAASHILQRANAIACRQGHPAVLPAHVLLAMLDQMPTAWEAALRLIDLSKDDVGRELLALLPMEQSVHQCETALVGTATNELVAAALANAVASQSNEIRRGHLVRALLSMNDVVVSAALAYRTRCPEFREAIVAACDEFGNNDEGE